jgi:uncharacterized membrane protein YraQ (UPF0718 family)
MWQPTTKQTLAGLVACAAIQYAINPTALVGYAIGAAIFASSMAVVAALVFVAAKVERYSPPQY